MENIQLVENEVVITNKVDATEYIQRKLAQIELIKQNIDRQIQEIQGITEELNNLL